MSAKSTRKTRRPTGRELPPLADYSDDISEEQLQRVKDLVAADEKEFEQGKILSGPAW